MLASRASPAGSAKQGFLKLPLAVLAYRFKSSAHQTKIKYPDFRLGILFGADERT